MGVDVSLYIDNLSERFFTGAQKDKISFFCMIAYLNIKHYDLTSIGLYSPSQPGRRLDLFQVGP